MVKQSPGTSVTVDGICGHAHMWMQTFYPVASRGFYKNKDKIGWVKYVLANDMQFAKFVKVSLARKFPLCICSMG